MLSLRHRQFRDRPENSLNQLIISNASSNEGFGLLDTGTCCQHNIQHCCYECPDPGLEYPVVIIGLWVGGSVVTA